eukprot:EG_transcript_1204
MGTRDDSPLSQSPLAGDGFPYSPSGRLRQAIFAARGSPKFPGSPRSSRADTGFFPQSSSFATGDDDDAEDRRSQVCTRGHLLQAQQRLEVERDFELREAYREERRSAMQEGKKSALTEVRATAWLVVWHTVASGMRIHGMVQRLRSTGVLQALFVPLCCRWHAGRQRRRRQREQEAALWARLGPPSERLLEDRAFFAGWPWEAKRRLVASLRPVQCDSDRLMLLEGDPGEEMYFIVSGRVDVIVRNTSDPDPEGTPRARSKSRRRDNGTVVATLTAGAHFGEFALVNDEPRMASVWCAEPTVCWALRREAFVAELLRFKADDPLRQEMDASILARRIEVMERLYPLTTTRLRSVPLFTNWSADSVAPLLAMVQPDVAEAGRVVVAEGAPAGHIHFVAHGCVQLWKRTAWWRAAVVRCRGPSGTLDGRVWDEELGELIATLQTGDVFGEVGVVTLEPHPYTAKAPTICDMWLLPRQKFKEFMLSRPTEYLQIKEVVNVKRAAWIDPLPTEALDRCAPLYEALGHWSERVLRAVLEALVPQVACPGDVLVCDGLLFVTKGTVEWQEYSQRVSAGEVFGLPRLTDHTLEAGSLRALSALEGWLLPMPRLCQLRVTASDAAEAISHAATASRTLPRGRKLMVPPTPLQLPGRKSLSPSSRPLSGPQSPTSPLRAAKDEAGGSLRMSGVPASPSGPLACSGSGAVEPRTPGLRSDSVRSPKATACTLLYSSSRGAISRRSSSKPDAARSPMTDTPPGQVQVFYRQRATEALRFAAGFMPPGFASRKVSTQLDSYDAGQSSPCRSSVGPCTPASPSRSPSHASPPSTPPATTLVLPSQTLVLRRRTRPSLSPTAAGEAALVQSSSRIARRASRGKVLSRPSSPSSTSPKTPRRA